MACKYHKDAPVDLQYYARRTVLPVRVVPPFSIQTYQKNTRTGAPPRSLPYNPKCDFASCFRTYYTRGDFPLRMIFKGIGNKIIWKQDICSLNYNYYLPIFFVGLRETKYPYNFFVSKGIHDLLENGKDKILPVLPQLILPLKNALSMPKPEVICETLKVLQHMVEASPTVGEALVPFYRHILPHMNRVKDVNINCGDCIDYSQQKRENIGDLVQETLETLESNGGEDAFIFIKYYVPTYQSCTIYNNTRSNEEQDSHEHSLEQN